ncbi:MAG TPA: hypothetical protein VFR55_01100 [Dehalococcoidia bacterium]|nr:hypothetical protein [Dehalococcoidia bacterium]
MFLTVLKRGWAGPVLFVLLGLTVAASNPGSSFEVWLVDQSNSSGTNHGGAIYVYDGKPLNEDDASSATPSAVIDLGGATTTLCFSATAANPARPHMLAFNSTHSHAILSFVASGHVVIFDAATRAPVSCIRTSAGAGGARQAHAAFPAPDDSYILVANQNGKLLERIDANFGANTFALNGAATLNLATCTTPNGIPCEIPVLRPNNSPICPVIDSTGSNAFITLAGGGLFVVDPTTEPMSILAEYDNATVHGNGCGGLEANGSIYINSGAGALATNPSEFDIYAFPLSGYDASNPVNSPAPVVVFSDDASAPERDSHGMVSAKHGRYLWVLDRARNVAEVFDTNNNRVNTVDLTSSLSSDPTADLGDSSPSGNLIFVSLRGPNPLTGSPHAATGTTPGLGIIKVHGAGKTGVMKDLIPITNVDGGGVERADAHGVRVRLK